jgi:hypothetical protein
MRDAQAVLDDLVEHAKPPDGGLIMLGEYASGNPAGPNWIAASGDIGAEPRRRYAAKLAELKKSDRLVDWSRVQLPSGYAQRAVYWIA